MKTDVKGFTLLELMMVVLLITIILGLSSFFIVDAIRLSEPDASGRDMSALIRQAKSLSRLQMDKRTFILDLDRRSYGIEGIAVKNIPPEILIKVIDPFSGELRSGQYSIVFNAGGATGGGVIVLSLRKKTIQIEIDPVSGAVVTRGKS